ncbi:class I SAM-dependent methyltransferase [Micromonospora sp. 15K316]|uniref:class I SAM-dependent methyltransferase n=1 Tax=Micromonospora sp. 15K316 TaxID=2530376 RepID=UPI001045B5D4|nr:class I SAM-dependent methyltransferase [Micromonospora sp. 15K316]TDC36691.1 class I SAM-dependent methyltransferase [Micromonospora sp. 15K316]
MTTFDHHERERWAGRAEAYTRSFGRLCAYPAQALLDAAQVAAGARVLDVGTGPGTVAALAAARGAAVTAVDAEASMIVWARALRAEGRFARAALPLLPFATGAFDAAVANFVINHVGDPRAAVTELRRVVRPGGQVAVTIWPHPLPPLQRLWRQAYEAAGGPPRLDLPQVAAERNFDRTPEGLTGLLRGAGLDAVRCETLSWVHRTDPEQWWAGPEAGIGQLGLLLDGAPADLRRRSRDAYDRLTDRYRGPDGQLGLPTAALVAAGRTR